jgi:putative nucleotidyltransferase with HDIG domain
LIGAILTADHHPLYVWIEKLSDNASINEISSLLDQSIDALEAVLDAADIPVEGFEPEFLQIRANVKILVQKALRRSHSSAAAGSVDIDARIDQLISKLELDDPPTAEHSRAVSLWCARIAKRMALTSDDALFVKRGGLIHDIGKMETPKEILHAPRALDDVEWEIMQQHPAQGAAIVAQIPELRSFVGVVRGHHERFDGRGYPDRLTGSDISIAARIVTVADSFNAMIAQRPYRRPFSPTVALEELKRHRGTQFDPRVVEAMIEVVRTGSEGPSSF